MRPRFCNLLAFLVVAATAIGLAAVWNRETASRSPQASRDEACVRSAPPSHPSNTGYVPDRSSLDDGEDDDGEVDSCEGLAVADCLLVVPVETLRTITPLRPHLARFLELKHLRC